MTVIKAEVNLLDWRKSRWSMGGTGDCVEVAPIDGKILVRDSKNRVGPVLEYSADAWRHFLGQAKRDRALCKTGCECRPSGLREQSVQVARAATSAGSCITRTFA